MEDFKENQDQPDLEMTEEKPAFSEPVSPKTEKKKADPRSKLVEPERMLVLDVSPHIQSKASVQKIMWTVIAALIPASTASIYFFGFPALSLIMLCIGSTVLTEMLMNFVKGEKLTVKDGSAAITGLLLALTLPPSFNITGAILGSVVAISIGKHVFGGLGYNIFNPALLGRAFLQASFPVAMTTWTNPGMVKLSQIDAVSTATPLSKFKFEGILTDHIDLFFGNTGGSLGETSAIAIIIGGVFLLIMKYADWRIPVSFIGSVLIVGGLFWFIDPVKYPDPIFQILSGGLLLGAFFMATDMVTSPITLRGSWIFGIGAGIILVMIRLFGGLPEGVMYSILLMNALTPLINHYTRPRFFGEPRS
ncbi:RnfABCDGE type electron transport complex subunit D [Candidatus Neomarinimicrobiota bacterium]